VLLTLRNDKISLSDLLANEFQKFESIESSLLRGLYFELVATIFNLLYLSFSHRFCDSTITYLIDLHDAYLVPRSQGPHEKNDEDW